MNILCWVLNLCTEAFFLHNEIGNLFRWKCNTKEKFNVRWKALRSLFTKVKVFNMNMQYLTFTNKLNNCNRNFHSNEPGKTFVRNYFREFIKR